MTSLNVNLSICISILERCRGRVVRAALLWCCEVTVKCEFEAGLHHVKTGKLCQPSSKWELGKEKAAKGEGRAPPFINYAKDIVGL